MACPISSLSHNQYGLFIANAGDGYARVYSEGEKEHLESIEEGYNWGWIGGSSKIGGFIEQDFVVVDWNNGDILWSVGIG